MFKPSEKWGPGEARYRQDWQDKDLNHADNYQESKEELHLPIVTLSGGRTNSAFKIN